MAVVSNTMEDILGTNDPCVECGTPTARFMGGFKLGWNRVSSDEGWLCEMCAGYECDECGNQIPVDMELRTEPYGNYHRHCYKQEHGEILWD